MIDKRFNRILDNKDNTYIPFYGAKFDISETYEGFVKCKLLHSIDDSIVFADQIYITEEDSKFSWFQPLTFLANLLIEESDKVNCCFHIDISVGNTLRIEFTSEDWVVNYKDNSSLFKCIIRGPINILEYRTGNGYFDNNVPFLKLYHHTLPRFKELILRDNQLKTSNWNIQGTKKLTNINYFYLTCLEKIEKPSDLVQIAMATEGKIHLLIDNCDVPINVKPDEIWKYKGSILEIQVYRESTKNRTSTLCFSVDATILSPKHLWKHLPENQFAFYEVCMPFIYRIGAKPNTFLSFSNLIICNQENLIQLEYQVIGLATKFKGLEAPYDEENTEYIFKIEKLEECTNILKFWFENTNTDLFTPKNIAIQEFEK